MLEWQTLHMISFLIIIFVFLLPIVAIITVIVLIIRYIKKDNNKMDTR